MGCCVPAPVRAQHLPGLQYLRLLGPLFDPRHAVGTTRARAGNRQLFYAPYAPLLLLSFFNPTGTSVRGLQQMTTFAHVQAPCGSRRPSLPAASCLPCRGGLWTVGAQAALVSLPCCPAAVGQDDQPRAAQKPVACAVLRPGPGDVTGTAGNASERAAVRRGVPPGGFSVFDRGSLDAALFQELHDLPCRFLGRVKAHGSYEGHEAHPVAAAARAAGVEREVVRRRVGPAHQTRVRPNRSASGRARRARRTPRGRPRCWCW